MQYVAIWPFVENKKRTTRRRRRRRAHRRSPATLARLRRPSEGARNSSILELTARKPRSALRVSATPGFWTFTTTSSPPSRSVAACTYATRIMGAQRPGRVSAQQANEQRLNAKRTWATDADARGTSSKLEKTSPRGTPRSASTMDLIVANSTVGLWSRHF